MDGSEGRRIPLTPRVRKLVGFAVLVFGVWFVGRQMAPVSPRETEVRVRLNEYRSPPALARSLRIQFDRGGEATRVLSERFGPSGPPREWRHGLTIAPGEYDATVTVEIDGRVATRETHVNVTAGEPIVVPAPIAQ